MTTTPSSSLSEQVETKLKTDYTWLQTHILNLAITGLLVLGGIYGVESIIARHDALVSNHYDALAAQSAVQNQVIQKQTADQISQLAAQNSQLQSQVSSLAQAISSRDAALLTLQKQVVNMQPPALAAEWPKYITHGTVTALPDGVKLDTPAAQDSLQQLESVPVLQADKKNLQDQTANQAVEITNDQTSLKASFDALANEKLSHIADQKACEADKKTLKAQARKGKLKAFFLGVVTGLVGGRFI
jgi:hypothetical protein